MSKKLKVYLSLLDTHEQTTIDKMITNIIRVSLEDAKDECPNLFSANGTLAEEGTWEEGEYGYYTIAYDKREAAMFLRDGFDYDMETKLLYL